MEWEFLGKQDLRIPRKRWGEDHYSSFLWRAMVPGGWLLLAQGVNSIAPQPIVSFYPDPDHLWEPNTPAESNYLLRPATGTASESETHLLRSVSETIEE